MFLQRFTQVATRRPDHPAVIDRHGVARSYAQLQQDIDLLRARLHAAGLRPGAVVATQLDNSTDYVALLFALASLGLVHCPIGMTSSPGQRAERLTQVAAAMLVTQTGAAAPEADVPAFALQATPCHLVPAPLQPHAGLMRMQETSGTTGAPKLALWRQDRLYREILHWVDSAGLDAEQRYLNIHSLDGGHGVDLHVFPALLSGATLYLGEAGEVEANLRTLVQQRISVMSALPSQYLELARAAQRLGLKAEALARPFCGGAYLDDHVVLQTSRHLGAHIQRIYGSTEFGMILANFDAGSQAGCGLYPVGDVQVELAPLDPAQPDIGELIARSDHRGSGYFPLPTVSEEAAAYATGDIAQRLADGSLMPLGRADDALLTQEGTLFAPGLENRIAQRLQFERVVVLVDPKDRRRAHIVLQAAPAQARDRQSELADWLAALGIEAGIAVLERVPLTRSGKPDRARLRTQLGACRADKDSIIFLKDL